MPRQTPNAALTESDVGRIKGSRLSVRELATDYDVSQETIRRIRRGETWAWVEPLNEYSIQPPADRQIDLALRTDEQIAEAKAAKERFLKLMSDKPTGDSIDESHD
jgi:transcriptional regulator with XRE-family HTH domain